MLISLVIPTLNERNILKYLFDELIEVLSSFGNQWEFELVIIDDGSIDGTREFVETVILPWPVKLIKRDVKGLATAVLAGFESSRGEIIIVMDADLSHPPRYLPSFIDEMKNADLVIGSRYVSGGGVEDWPTHRRFASRAASMLARPLSGGVQDPLSGFFVLKRKLLAQRYFRPLGYKILLEILVRSDPQKIKELPYVFRNRSVGKSKLNSRVTKDYFRHLARLYLFSIKKFLNT